MDFQRYYLDLLEILNSSCKKIAKGKYDQSDVDKLFELAKTQRYPSLFSELAESFGMMITKLEAREYHLKQVIEDLEKEKSKKK
jgi:hypothetical protein